MEELTERYQIKRRYGQYEAKHVNANAPVRDSIVKFVSDKSVTEKEIKDFLSMLAEDRGKSINVSAWFKNNNKYFQSTTEGSLTLSKYGKRVLEYVLEQDKNKKLNEGKELTDKEISEAFNFLLKSNNQAAIAIAKVVKQQMEVIGYTNMLELLKLIHDDLYKNGSTALNTYLK
jgi:hypothetical protein